jgi:hypothetical protein
VGPWTEESKRKSPEYLIKVLNDDIEGLKFLARGEIKEDREAAVMLVGLGPQARPHIDNALKLLENGSRSPSAGSRWLLWAFARLEGTEGYSRLEKMLLNNHLSGIRREIDRAIAVSLSLTSFHSAFPETGIGRALTDGELPQDTLDRAILGWLSNDRRMVDGALSSRAQAKLHDARSLQEWQRSRTGLRAGSLVSFGYKMNLPVGLSRHDESGMANLASQLSERRLKVHVELYSRAARCTRFSLDFLRTRARGPQYVIDSVDPRWLVDNVASCVAAVSSPN